MYLIYATLLFVNTLAGWSGAWTRGDWEKYGPVQVVLNSKLIKCNHEKNLNLDISEMFIYFYDFSENIYENYPIEQAARGILSVPGLDKTKKIIFYVGGYKSHINKHSEERIRDTFRKNPNSYLLIIDHSSYTNDKLGYKKGYERSVAYAHYIGKALGQFLADLAVGGVTPNNVHCIGHSLGGQILGTAGETFTNITGNKIWRITALDPAGPCFSNSLIQDQIRSGLAEYVEVYHCNAGGLGSSSVLGDIDFFVNKLGQSQPNCGTPLVPGIFDSTKAAKCSHRTCLQIYTTSVKHPEWFPAWKCDSYNSFKKSLCFNDNITTAGYSNPGTASGLYFFSTEGYLID